MQDPSTTFLFWNIHKQLVTDRLVRLVESHGVDVVLLAESPYKKGDARERFLSALNVGPRLDGSSPFEEVAESAGQRVQIVSRLRAPIWKVEARHPHYAIWSLAVDSGRRLVVAAAHFPSIQEDQGDGQRKVATELRQDLERVEAASGGSSADEDPPLALVVGDLNANPFDAGIAGIYGLNATPSRGAIRRGAGVRTLHGRSYAYLYNPMWQFFGSEREERNGEAAVPGTYYLRNHFRPVDYGWYVLDQVLVRPSLLPYLRDSDVRIVTRDAPGDGISLLTSHGLPLREIDHLPVLFRLSV